MVKFRKPAIVLFDRTGLDKDTVKALNLMAAAIMGGMVWGNITGGIAMTDFLKALGATDLALGLIIAIPYIANSLQFIASYVLTRWLPRKKTFIITGLIQRAVWIPFGLVPFFVPMEMAAMRIWIVTVLALISAGMMPLFSAALFSLYDDAIPIRIRSRYFSARIRVATGAGLIMGLVTAWILDAMPGFTGYAVVFIIAGALGVADIICYVFIKFPPMKRERFPEPIFTTLRGVLKNRNYMRLVAFGALWYLGVFISAPFNNVYMLSMKITITQITLLAQVTSSITSILVVTKWGRAYERFGTRPVLILNVCVGALVPCIWVFVGPGMLWLIFIAFAISGMQWTAFEIGGMNLFMGLAPEKNRSMYFAAYFIGTQLIGMALGQAAGGWLSDNAFAALEALNISLGGRALVRYHYLFMLSFVIRALSVALLPGIREDGALSVSAVVGLALGGRKSIRRYVK
jgi:MFS family permease